MPLCVRASLGKEGQLYCAESSHRLCAERRLLERWFQEARRHGRWRRWDAAAWVRRKLPAGVVLSVQRAVSGGGEGCSQPCVFCHRLLAVLNIPVLCKDLSGNVFCGFVGDTPIRPCLTSAWRRQLGPPK